MPTATVHHFAKAPLLGQTAYMGLTALVLNLAVTVVFTLVLRLVPHTVGRDQTVADDYVADAGEAGVAAMPAFTTTATN